MTQIHIRIEKKWMSRAKIGFSFIQKWLFHDFSVNHQKLYLFR